MFSKYLSSICLSEGFKKGEPVLSQLPTTMLKTRHQKTNQQKLKGKKNIDDILDFEKLEGHSLEDNSTEKREKPSLLPKNCKSISPIECFQSLVNKHDKKSMQHVYFMCLSFILQSEDTITLNKNSSSKILANYIFREKPKKRESKSKTKNEEENVFQGLMSEMKYFISSDFATYSFIQVQPVQGSLDDILDRKLYLNIANYSSEDFNLAANTPLGKIYFYF